MTRVVLAAVLLVGMAAFVAADQSEDDSIRILFVDPPGPVSRGVETEFVVDVEAELRSEEEGEANIGFNVESPRSFRMIDSYMLGPGSQRFTFKVKVIPVDWGERAKFRVMVNMGPRSSKVKWEPTAWDEREIEVRP